MQEETNSTIKNLEKEIALLKKENLSLKEQLNILNNDNNTLFYKKAIDVSNDAIFVIRGKRFLYFNKKLMESTEYSKEELQKINTYNLVYSEDKKRILKELIEHRNNNHESYIFGCRIITKSGKIRFGTFYSHKTIYEGKPAIFTIVHDTTIQQELEERLKNVKTEMEKISNAKIYFLSNISHELRTPLNAMLGFTDLLISEEDNAAKKEKLIHIKDAGVSLLKIIDDIIKFSYIESGKYVPEQSPVMLNHFIDSIDDIYSGKCLLKSLRFDVVRQTNIPDLVLGDTNLLFDIVESLMDNAIKFTPEGKVTITFAYHKDTLKIRIIDTGIGINKDKIDTIFHHFEQVSQSTNRVFEGTGMGLAITKKLLDIMNGKIKVESELEKGSIFTVIIKLPTVNF